MIAYHSHPATRQDEWVIKQTHNGVGYFVEVGAHDGVRHSNTLALEQSKGWKGLLVEPNPILFNAMKQNRPDAKCVQAAVGPYNDPCQRFVLGDAYGGLVNHMPADWLAEHMRRKNRIIDIDTVQLGTLLVDNNCPSEIGYLSLDVEGAELPILQSFYRPSGPWTHFNIKLITVEFRYDKFLLDKLEEVLFCHELVEIRGFDACFVSKD